MPTLLIKDQSNAVPRCHDPPATTLHNTISTIRTKIYSPQSLKMSILAVYYANG